MNMIGHNHKFVHKNAGDKIAGKNVFLNDSADSVEIHLRGVEGAAPYDVTQQAFLVLNTNCYKICAWCAVIKVRQTVRFAFW